MKSLKSLNIFGHWLRRNQRKQIKTLRSDRIGEYLLGEPGNRLMEEGSDSQITLHGIL